MKPIAITVSKLNAYIKEMIDDDEFLNNVLVCGEISNFKQNKFIRHNFFI